MAQIILAPGQTPAMSDDVVVAPGEQVTVGIYSAAGAIPNYANLVLLIETPGEDLPVAELNRVTPIHVISGAGTFKVKRTDISRSGVDVGAFTE